MHSMCVSKSARVSTRGCCKKGRTPAEQNIVLKVAGAPGLKGKIPFKSKYGWSRTALELLLSSGLLLSEAPRHCAGEYNADKCSTSKRTEEDKIEL